MTKTNVETLKTNCFLSDYLRKRLAKFYQHLLSIVPFDRKSKRKGECNIFNVQNISLAKYSYSNIDDIRCRDKKEKVYEKCPEKNAIISRGALNRESTLRMPLKM